jgi:hypothetical protein
MDELPESAAEQWMILDDEFYTYPDDLTTLMRRYVEAHREEFRPW